MERDAEAGEGGKESDAKRSSTVEVAYALRALEPVIHLRARVVHGYKRGSKELGFPTANLCMSTIEHTVERMETGIYYGFAMLRGIIYRTVASVGWNPFYNNTHKTLVRA
jgi:FAD synthase